MANRRPYLVVVLSDYLRDHPTAKTLWKGPQAFVASALGTLLHHAGPIANATLNMRCEHAPYEEPEHGKIGNPGCDCMGIMDAAELATTATLVASDEEIRARGQRNEARMTVLAAGRALEVSTPIRSSMEGTDEEWRDLGEFVLRGIADCRRKVVPVQELALARERDYARSVLLALARTFGVQAPKTVTDGDQREWEALGQALADRSVARRVVRRGYEALAHVLDDALDQAQDGKGHARHGASSDVWQEQVIGAIPILQRHPGGLVYQGVKKLLELEAMTDPAARYREALGAIIYAAGVGYFVASGDQKGTQP